VKLRTKVPAPVKAIPTRRLGWGVTADGLAIVASPECLWIGPDEQLPWNLVEKAGWKPDVLTVHEMAEVEGTGRSRSWELAEEHRLAEFVHTQVTASVRWSDVRKLSPDGKVRYVGRRQPDTDLLLWQVVWQEGTDPADPFLRAQVEQTLDGLKKTIG
jgi:hypothetical protein